MARPHAGHQEMTCFSHWMKGLEGGGLIRASQISLADGLQWVDSGSGWRLGEKMQCLL